MPTIDEAFAIALQHHQAGRLQQAEQIYRQILQADPHAVNAWNMLGGVAHQANQHAAAAECFAKAASLQPQGAEYWQNLGVALTNQGKLAEAEACFRTALDLRPDFLQAQQGLQNALRRSYYPMFVPALKVQPGLDFLMLLLPPFDANMPNSIGYLHNTLLTADVCFQTVDANVILRHRFYQRRALAQQQLRAANGYPLKDDLWGFASHCEWDRKDVQDFFWPELADVIRQIAQLKPKAVGLSVHASNNRMCRRFVKELRQAAPDVLVIVGGYDCHYVDVGPKLFPDFDYMCILEADLTLAPLVQAIARGQRPKDLDGIVSRFDTPDRKWRPAPLLEDLDAVDIPRYQWINQEVYQVALNTVPISTSRGCVWGRCRFCAECFPFRVRKPRKVVDEMEEWVKRNARIFYFFESDVNGSPEVLHDVCTEVLRRGLKVGLSGQLRIHKNSTLEYFQHLVKAGFGYLRFGVDGWTDRMIQMQRKGYNMAMVEQNLRDCKLSGMTVSVNLVLGVPGETDEDIDETIASLVRLKPHYDLVEFVNLLNLRTVSEYFQNHEKYKIVFRGDKEEIRRQHPYSIPDDLWYSEEPYIDWEVRKARLYRVIEALNRNGIPVAQPVQMLLEGLKRPDAFVNGQGEVRYKSEELCAV